MMAKKKEEGGRKRKRKDIDIINDNDDIIAQLIGDMRNAAEVRNDYLRNHDQDSQFGFDETTRQLIRQTTMLWNDEETL